MLRTHFSGHFINLRIISGCVRPIHNCIYSHVMSIVNMYYESNLNRFKIGYIYLFINHLLSVSWL